MGKVKNSLYLQGEFQLDDLGALWKSTTKE